MKLRAVSLLLIAMCATCNETTHAEETPAYKRFKSIAKEMANLGMPVELEGVRLTIKEPTTAEFLYGMGSTEFGHGAARRRGTRVVVGNYDESDNRITIMAGGRPIWADGDSLVAHELSHLSRYQRNPTLLARSKHPTTEQAMIYTCLLEGEARLASLLLQSSRRGKRLESFDISPTNLDVRMGTEPVGLSTAYSAGLRFMAEHAKRHGVASLSRVYAAPPVSTEHVLHPLKLGRDNPTSIKFPALPTATLVSEDTVGELHLQSELASKLEPLTALRAAIGWDGDRIRRYEFDDGRSFDVWVMVWDREIDAIQAESAIRERWPTGATRRTRRTVTWVCASSDALKKKLGKLVSAWDCSGELDVVGARTASVVEVEATRLWNRSNRLEGGRWHLPIVRISIPVPAGWHLRLTGDGARLRKNLRGASPDIVVRSWPLGPFGTLDELSRHLRRPPHPLYWMRTTSVDLVEDSGTTALLVTRLPMRGRRLTRYELVELYVPVGGAVVRFGTMLLRNGVHSRERQEVISAFSQFRIDRD